MSSGLSLTNSTVTKNTSKNGYGGGIASDTYDNTSPVTLQNSTITNNRELNGPGGGIANVGESGLAATLTISSSTLAGNTASGLGGAIYNTVSDSSSGASASVTIDHSTIGPRPHFLNDGNRAHYGGGIANDGATGPSSVSVQSGANVTGNTASVDGGGVYNVNGGTLLIGPGASVAGNHPDDVS